MSEEITNKLILEEIRKTRQELKAIVEAVEVNVLKKIEETNKRINKVEQHITIIDEKLEEFDKIIRKNNIIIFGLTQPQQIKADVVCQELKRLVDVDINLSELNDFYPLGKTKNCPLKVEFTSYLKKALILRNLHKLKGSNISIANDQTPKQREENKILRKHLQQAKQNVDNICFIKRNKLHINDEIYTPEELKNCEQSDIINPTKSNSEPKTPAIQTASNRAEGKEQELNLNTPKKPTTPAESAKGKKEVKEASKVLKENKIKTRSGTAPGK
ncbi:hypothetical protein NQ314_013997 [Rhamnusium bicolor]|uniref:Endonuclease-reverse transcriptase n=1 Tax=Rhamnusium bicolor TaxID=1586634 RepID=A0AAV8X3U5_9CUCU|nr:hypothetical protein NQ314_013997 [Rhamnusium bicolor]